MTLVHKSDIGGPATHALVIGVGGYDHLEGGGGEELGDASAFGNLGQLTSPPVSALALTKFLASSVSEQWAAPIATIDLLVSAAPGQRRPMFARKRCEPATRDAIQVAFEAWFKRCETSADNVALFYFCGHGLQATNQVLLASDFGRFENPWLQSFDFNRTRLACRACKAQTQIFLIDACREITTSTVEVPNPNAPALREPKRRQPENCKHDLTIQSTSRTQKAFGEENEVSYFTKAILMAFEGAAAQKRNGEWWVTSSKIVDRIDLLLELVDAKEAQNPEIGISKPTRLYRLSSEPEAFLEFGCQPGVATFSADLCWWKLPGGAAQTRPERALNPWRVPVTPGPYQISASFPEGGYENSEDTITVEPPLTVESLRVRATPQ